MHAELATGDGNAQFFAVNSTEDSLKATPKPSSAMSATHQKSVVSKRQAERMRKGRVESRPEDYKNIAPSEQAKRLHAARARLEDRQMMKDLGLSD